MKLSIITVNLNNRDGLQRTIDSVISQTFTDYEWIVIDGGSTDGSRELIEQYSDHFAYWCSEPDKGIYNAMNKGIVHAKGEWLQFLNSGDYLFKKYTLEKVFSYQHQADVLYGDMIIESEINTEYRVYPDILNLDFFYECSLGHQSSFFKHSLFKYRKYNEEYRIVSDWEYGLKLFSENYMFKHIPLFISVFENNGISTLFDSENIKERKKVLLDYIPIYYKQDIEYFYQIREREILIQKHKFLRWIALRQEKKIFFISNLIKSFEKLKKNM